MQAKIIERVVADLRAQSYRQDAQANDAALLEAFLTRRDQTAFAVLVQRHGPMVLGVCRRILGHAQDAEDAFQAAFWVLARKAHAVRPRGYVGNWLYGVAVRTALKARGLRRRRRELQVDAMPPQMVAPVEPNHDVQAVLDEEIERLPAKYRLAVVLCELQGCSRMKAAKQLGVAEGTLSSRLAYARRLLAKRLQARGVALAVGGGTITLAEQIAGAAVPHALLASTIQAASATAPSSAAIASLVKGMVAAMFLSKLKQIAALALLCAVALGFGLGSRHLWTDANANEPPATNSADQAEQAPPLLPVAQPRTKAGKTDPQAKDTLLGLWRVLQIETRYRMQEGAGAGPLDTGGVRAFGAGNVGPKGGGAVVPKGGGGPPPRAGQTTVYDGLENGKSFLRIAADQALWTTKSNREKFHLTIGPGTFDYTLEDQNRPVLGIYVLDGNQLRLYFYGGPDKESRPKGPKDAYQTWTLMRPPTRQQIYQRLDQLQGDWKAVSGEFNGEAFLPRELKSVSLNIRDGHWQMTGPNQPGQPDAVPRRFFNAQYEFVLDNDGPRNLLIVQSAGPQPSEQRILYELRGDELKVCWSTRWDRKAGGVSETPKEFKTTPGSDLVLFVLKRPKDEPETLPPGAPGSGNTTPSESAPAKTVDTKLIVKVHAVADLMDAKAGKEAVSLIQVITKTIEPTSWELVGGNGSIEYFPEGKSLVINQTADIHMRIVALLIEMRQAKMEQERKQAK